MGEEGAVTLPGRDVANLRDYLDRAAGLLADSDVDGYAAVTSELAGYLRAALDAAQWREGG